MLPTYEEMLKGCVRWSSRYKDVGIELTFHGYYPEHGMKGIWCYYLVLNEEMFYEDDWKKLVMPVREDDPRFHNYYEFPDVDFHAGITFYEITSHTAKDGRSISVIKAGCDYGHLWDEERGYPDNYDSVLFDAKRSVSKLLELFPNRRMRCAWSGKWDEPDMFYESANGNVHKSFLEKMKESNYPNWLPKEESNG